MYVCVFVIHARVKKFRIKLFLTISPIFLRIPQNADLTPHGKKIHDKLIESELDIALYHHEHVVDEEGNHRSDDGNTDEDTERSDEDEVMDYTEELPSGTGKVKNDDKYEDSGVTGSDEEKKPLFQAPKLGKLLKDNKRKVVHHVYILIRCPLHVLRKYAMEKELMMLLDREELRKHTIMRAMKEINDDPQYCSYDPYESIYARYTDKDLSGHNIDEKLYWRPEGLSHPFRTSIRLHLTHKIIEDGLLDLDVEKEIEEEEIRRSSKHLFQLNIHLGFHDARSLRVKAQIKSGYILALYPLHDVEVSHKLLRHWTYIYNNVWELPIWQIKEYYGEKIALFVALTSHFSTWLIVPAIIGIPLTLLIILNDWDFSSIFLPAFAFLMCIWAIIMLEFWKRREAELALSWGTIDFEDIEEVRPEFKGKDIKSYIDGEDITYFPPSERSKLILYTSLAIFGVMLLVLGVVVGIYVLRYVMYGHPSLADYGLNAQSLASSLNAIVILIANPIYFDFATYLCTLENHRTDSSVYNSMVGKLFVFQFVNSYASFLYLAFIAAYVTPAPGTPEEYLGDCGFDNCMKPLAINLIFVFMIRLVFNNILVFVLPYITYQSNLLSGKVRKRDTNSVIANAEGEFLLDTYDTDNAMLADTSDLVIQFGYVTMFIVAMPLAATFALVCNLIKMKGDAWALIMLHRRPIPITAANIGVWQDIFTIISIFAIISNGGMTVLTMNVINDYRSSDGGFWFFTCFQWFGFLFQYFFFQYIDDVSPDVVIQVERTQFFRKSIFNKKLNQSMFDIVQQISNRFKKKKKPPPASPITPKPDVSTIHEHISTNFSPSEPTHVVGHVSYIPPDEVSQHEE